MRTGLAPNRTWRYLKGYPRLHILPPIPPSDMAAPLTMPTSPEVDLRLPRWSLPTLLLAWSVPATLGVPFALVSLRTAPPGLAAWRVVVVVVVAWQVWALLSVPVLALADRLPVSRPWPVRAVAAHVVASLTACAVQALATATVYLWLVDPGAATLGELSGYMFLRFAPSGVLVYAAILAIRTSQVHHARAVAREAESQALARRLAEARLQSLRSQLRPHFLFNALNATVALVRDGENDRAADALVGIGALLRATLRADGRHEITLEEEIAFVEQYLAIEQLRMGDRLRVQLDVPERLLDARVPSLCLQPFVENAVRHGLRGVAGDAVIAVSAQEQDGRLLLRVTDNGAGLPAGLDLEGTSGIGVSNTQARLDLLHGPAASVRLGVGDDGRGTTAELVVPLTRIPR
jgi:signal transduction histidine kinase